MKPLKSLIDDNQIEVLKKIVREAGIILQTHQASPTGVELKKDQTFVSTADKASSSYITQELRRYFPDHGIIDEESHESAQRETSKDCCWVVDPLDGTREYLQGGKNFGIILGLMNFGVPVFGMTYRPMLDELIYAVRGKGAYRDSPLGPEKIKVSLSNELNLVVTESRLEAKFRKSIDSLTPKTVRQQGGSLKVIEVALGNSTLFLQPPQNTMHLWDLCGTSLILEEAGGKITDWQGKNLSLSLDNLTYNNGIIASNRRVHPYVVPRLSEKS